MARQKAPSETRRAILLYPEVKERFDRFRVSLGETQTGAMRRLLDNYDRHNEVKV